MHGDPPISSNNPPAPDGRPTSLLVGLAGSDARFSGDAIVSEALRLGVVGTNTEAGALTGSPWSGSGLEADRWGGILAGRRVDMTPPGLATCTEGG